MLKDLNMTTPYSKKQHLAVDPTSGMWLTAATRVLPHVTRKPAYLSKNPEEANSVLRLNNITVLWVVSASKLNTLSARLKSGAS